MKAIILAAGRGSRMHEGTKNNPKCMMKVCGKTLLERCMDTLLASGFKRKDIAIVTGYKSEMIESTIKDVTFFHNGIWEKTNMVYSLSKAESWLTRYDCCVFYSDIIFSSNAVRRTIETEGQIVMPYYTGYLDLWKRRFQNPLDDLETFKVKQDGSLEEIGSKPLSYDQIHGQYMGIVKFTPTGWKVFKDSVQRSQKSFENIDMTSLLSATIQSDLLIQCVPCSEMWLECDNLNDIAIYEKLYGDCL